MRQQGLLFVIVVLNYGLFVAEIKRKRFGITKTKESMQYGTGPEQLQLIFQAHGE